MVYTLERPGSDYKIGAVEVDELKVHEGVLPAVVNDLAVSIGRDGYLRNPVIVEERNSVVLDGTHRARVLREIGCNVAPICLVDYYDPTIELRSCDRIARCGIETVLDLCLEMGFSVRSCGIEEADESVRNREAELALLSGDLGYLMEKGLDSLMKISWSAAELEGRLRSRGIKTEHSAKTGAFILEDVGTENTIIKLPPARKEEVIDAARSKDVFAPRTTRHVIPDRPLNARAPISWLREGDREEVDGLLSRRLESSESRIVDPEEYAGDRAYEERLWVFENLPM